MFVIQTAMIEVPSEAEFQNVFYYYLLSAHRVWQLLLFFLLFSFRISFSVSSGNWDVFGDLSRKPIQKPVLFLLFNLPRIFVVCFQSFVLFFTDTHTYIHSSIFFLYKHFMLILRIAYDLIHNTHCLYYDLKLRWYFNSFLTRIEMNPADTKINVK